MKVYFGKNFWGHPSEGETPMQEVSIRQEFVWGELSGFIPAIYVSREGLVMDFCIRVPNEKVQAFLDKWADKLTGCSSDEEQEQITRENPLDIDFNVKLLVNGKELENAFGCGASYSKIVVEEYERRYQKSFRKDSLELQLMQEYACEDNLSWCFKRHTCRWEQKPEVLDSLEIKFISGRKEYFGEALEIGVEDAGHTFEIQSPIDGSTYQLHIYEVEFKELNPEIFKVHRDMHRRRIYVQKEKEENLEKCAIEIAGKENPERCATEIAGEECPDRYVAERVGKECPEVDGQRKEEMEYQDAIEYPSHYLAISYDMSAVSLSESGEKLTYEQFRLKDSSKGDKARRVRQYQTSAVSVIVGAVDGPTSVFIAGKKKDMERQLAVSYMYFEPVDNVRWIPVFLKKEREDITLLLLGGGSSAYSN